MCVIYGWRVESNDEITADKEQILEFCREPRVREKVAKGICVQVATARRKRIILLVLVGKLSLIMSDMLGSKSQR